MIEITATNANSDIAARENHHQCGSCLRWFRTVRGLNQHQRSCLKLSIVTQISTEDLPISSLISSTISDKNYNFINDPSGTENLIYKWGLYSNAIFENNLIAAYEKIVYWRKNLFMLPTGKSGKEYIAETTRLMNAWVEDSPLKDIAFTAIMVMPALLLQKPSKSSKSKDHGAALERRLLLWKKCGES